LNSPLIEHLQYAVELSTPFEIRGIVVRSPKPSQGNDTVEEMTLRRRRMRAERRGIACDCARSRFAVREGMEYAFPPSA
jgi:hypothetical protein